MSRLAGWIGGSVGGAPFYLMEYVPGVVIRSRWDTAPLTGQQNADQSERLADMLAAIHGAGTEAVGLSGLGRGAGYARRTGRDISRIGYYMASGYFKLAVVLEGIYARYLLHQAVQAVGEGFEHEGLAVPTLVARAHQVLDADD